jgi:hypothetical protein
MITVSKTVTSSPQCRMCPPLKLLHIDRYCNRRIRVDRSRNQKIGYRTYNARSDLALAKQPLTAGLRSWSPISRFRQPYRGLSCKRYRSPWDWAI